MSELLKKYESLDQSKLNEGTIKILNRVKTITADASEDTSFEAYTVASVVAEIISPAFKIDVV
jgi:hypothetical protein